MGKYFCNNRGVALILVLMIIAIIVVVTLDFNSNMRTDLTAAANVRDGIMLRCAATSGFHYALGVLAEDADTNDFDTLREDWANADVLLEGVSGLEGLAHVRLEVIDCERKIQINKLIEGGKVVESREKLLRRFLLLEEFGLDPETVTDMVDSVIDWIDPETEMAQLNGAEDAYYQSLDLPYGCNNGPIRSIASLRKVKGFRDIPQEIFDEIVKHMTPSGDGKININTAPEEEGGHSMILEVLHERIDEELAKDMVDYRKKEENDLRFITWYERVPSMVDIEIEDKEELITTKSSFFQISSTASITVGEGKGSLTKRVTGVVMRSEKAGKKRIDVLSQRVE